MRKNIIEANDLVQHRLEYKMTFDHCSIIFIGIIDQSIIANMKQQCNDKQNSRTFIVKKFTVFLLFTKVLLHLI